MRPLLALLCLCLGCSIGPQLFPCEDDAACGAGGLCEGEGFCSFADPACDPSGRRFGDGAPADLAGSCVTACIAHVYTGAGNTCVQDVHGALSCWGWNQAGLLGNGGQDLSVHPRPDGPLLFAPGSTATFASLSNTHGCAIAEGPEPRGYCWGDNSSDAVSPSVSSAVVSTPLDVGASTHITAGHHLTCALTAGGGVSCWGANDVGQLGDDLAPLPPGGHAVVVDGAGLPLAGMITVAAASSTACAGTATGLWCWGGNGVGGLGDGQTADQPHAVPVLLPAGTIDDLDVGTEVACAIVDGDVFCWGSGVRGELGRNPTLVPGGFDSTPTLVPLRFGAARRVVAGSEHVCALSDGGSVVCWGDNSVGQLGPDASGPYAWVPVAIPLTNVVDIAAGGSHACALTASRQLYCWGANNWGQTSGLDDPRDGRLVRVHFSCSPD